MIHFKCTYCGRKLKINREYEGRQGRCPLCGQFIWVPRTISDHDTSEIPVLPLLPDEAIEEDPSKSGVLQKGSDESPSVTQSKHELAVG